MDTKIKDKSTSDSKIRGNMDLSTFCLYTVYALEIFSWRSAVLIQLANRKGCNMHFVGDLWWKEKVCACSCNRYSYKILKHLTSNSVYKNSYSQLKHLSLFLFFSFFFNSISTLSYSVIFSLLNDDEVTLLSFSLILSHR